MSVKYYIGIDIGGTNLVAAVVDENGAVYERATLKTNMPRSYQEILDDCAVCARLCAENSGIDFENIEAVGIGCPGSINFEDGSVETANNLQWYNVPVVEYMERKLGKKVYIENDANAAAWGEFVVGSGKNTKNMVLITLGTGVGGGIISEGKLVRGEYGKGAELGHTVICVDGEKCNCGRRGCLEAYASATALIKMTKGEMKKYRDSDLWRICGGKLSNVSGATVFKCNDKLSKEIIKKYLNYLSEGVVNIVNMLQPEIICIGGGISNAGEKLLVPIAKKIKEKSYARMGKEQTTVKLASLGNDAGIIGAALLWKNKEGK